MSDEVSQESNSDDHVDPLSADQIFINKDCTVDFEIYEDFTHIKSGETHPILGSIGDFCGAFYHVPGDRYRCLDENNCKISQIVKENVEKKTNPRWIPPKTVVALVKYEMHDGSENVVRYSNHYMQNATKHAEEFFSDDIINQASDSVAGTNLQRITMYITLQPCHRSIDDTPNKSCCNVLLKLLQDPQLKNVQICIKPTHTYKAGSRDEHLELVESGKKGIGLLMATEIEINRMEEDDWNFLYNLVAMNDNERRRIPLYSRSCREALDKEIGVFLCHLRCGPTHHCLVVNQTDVPHLFDNLFQLCAFFHVFEQGAGNASLCLNQSQSPCSINGQEKPNVIVVKGKPYEAKYTDCHRCGIKAEQFLHYDAPGLSDNRRDSGIMNRITIYTTWLPRGFSEMVWPLTRCTLVNVCIKPSHLHGGDTSREDVAEEVVDLRRNRYIRVKSMTEEDWKYMTECLPEADRARVPEYENSRRQHLDNTIEEFLNPQTSGGGGAGASGGSNSQGPSGGGDSGGGDSGSGCSTGETTIRNEKRQSTTSKKNSAKTTSEKQKLKTNVKTTKGKRRTSDTSP